MCLRRALQLMLLLVLVFLRNCTRVRHHSNGKQALKFMKDHALGSGTFRITADENTGLWPSVFNVATKALISTNATCGDRGREEFCRMSEGGRGRCGICDNFSPDPGKRHPIHYAIDGSNRWWQSPALYYGSEFEYVTITLDLKQVYQVAYVIIKAANSPRPGTWILEHSIDGEDYEPWQFFATSDKECLERYGIPAKKGKPHYDTDTQVICTSFYSRLTPMENGEIHTSLILGRPGANETSPELLEFTKARYVRFVFQGLRGSVEPLPRWFSQDISKNKRLFYSVRDISIGGQCVCNGHAGSCRHNVASGHPECECSHNTCGPNCEKCCPLYNQKLWGPGTSRDSRQCLPCNCHGHATSCHYEENVDRAGLSLDIHGNYQGGGVCDNCTDYTTGINCEQCVRGYYRPKNIARSDKNPCIKCDCDPFGSTGFCGPEGELAGLCECRPGYAGSKCDTCAEGYRGYPNCELCPCDTRGVLNVEDCEGECICKVNVEGKFCDRCKPGHFALRSDNYEGCSACYCSGITTLCESAILVPRKFETLDDWLISDLQVTEIEKPIIDDLGMISVGNYEIQGIEAYYWLAPKLYIGNKLEAYGSYFDFKVNWMVMRGDTSGKPTQGPNIIVVGSNGLQIAYGDDLFEGNNKEFNIKLMEHGWYHVPLDIKDIITRLRRDGYKGDPVTRQQFLGILSNIKYILLRAKFHTDQLEASLEYAILHTSDTETSEIYSTVEKCSCPSGYTGLSCETCAYGYVRIITNTSAHEQQGFCVKCDCNGHSETCNPDTGECYCQHNTVGEKCERCIPGYYGNPLRGTLNDCKKCACPLENEDNNFSPSCQLDYLNEEEEVSKYVCTQCPKGYTGDHCEICDDGYFGNPKEKGGSCRLCSCNGGPCDRKTGQCLSCKGNTEGWKCERCKQGHYGDPFSANCQPCQCDPIGALSKDCDNVTGQCMCKERFTGRTCDRCQDGYGNVTAHCTPCECNTLGSKSDLCDPHTGMCDCQPGVEGFHCDACQHSFYGFSSTGCQGCNCNYRGSELPTCDIKTGQCRCKTNYIGITCDRCQLGYWESQAGCIRCQCNQNGSSHTNCDPANGRCFCKPGVGGNYCDFCLPKYYGFSNNGCKACQPCNKRGHICNPDTGACVCPPFSEGEFCQNCVKDSWGYEPDKGCKSCKCSQTGSLKLQCDKKTGQCTCKQGFEGEKCDRCSHGYYGYPKCRRCSCNLAGTDADSGRCDKQGICQCDQHGNCPCKINVSGRRCSSCKENTFGLHSDNPEGCTKCFCFGRSKKCTEAGLTWDQERTKNRSVILRYDIPRQMLLSNDINTLREIPNDLDDAVIDVSSESPPYWSLPSNFVGDLTLSYGGYIRFTTTTHGSRYISEEFKRYPLIRLEGKETVLESHGLKLHKSFEAKLHESQWTDRNKPISREQLMVILQNVKKILIKATDAVDFDKALLLDVTLDKGKAIKGYPQPRAYTIEKCECPKEYTGNSCQDPNVGYYRYFGKDINDPSLNWIEKVLGKAKPCQCNELSNICDRETGYCTNCRNNTAGKYCEVCAEGFYKENRKCLPCHCPTKTQNFAKGCVPGRKPNQFACSCKEGYAGTKCDKCSEGYYGRPLEKVGSCKPCNCNRDGSVHDRCNNLTGKCTCKPGFAGLQCSQCENPRHVIDNHRCSPCDPCTQLLLDDLDELSNILDFNTSHIQNGIEPPWQTLRETEERYLKLTNHIDDYETKKNKIKKIIRNTDLQNYSNDIHKIQNSFGSKIALLNKTTGDVQNIVKESQTIFGTIDGIEVNLERIIKDLNTFGKLHKSTKEALKEAKELLRNIKDIAKQFQSEDDYQSILDNCITIEELVKKLSELNISPDNVQKLLLDVTYRIKSLENLIRQIAETSKEAKDKNKINSHRIQNLNQTIKELEARTSKINDDINNINDLKSNISELHYQTRNNLDNLSKNKEFLELVNKLDEKEKNISDSIPVIEDYVARVNKYAEELEKNATEYSRLFNFTDEEWKKIHGTEAYENLYKNIEAARNAAKDAQKELKKALEIISPKGSDSLVDKTSIAKGDSSRLEARVTANILNKQSDINDNKKELSELNQSIWRNAKINNDQTYKLRKIQEEIARTGTNLTEIEMSIRNTNDLMQKVYKNINSINVQMIHDLGKNFQKYLNLTTNERIRELKDRLTLTKGQLQDVFVEKDTYLHIIRRNNRTFGANSAQISTVDQKLKELKAKIQRAKEAADVIRVSLALNCNRIYQINSLEPSIFTKLSVSLQIKDEFIGTHSLFHIKNDKKQHMELLIKSQNPLVKVVEFSWKLGTENRKLKNILKDTSETLQIDVDRVGNVLKLITNNHVNISVKNEDPAIFSLSPDDLVSVGKKIAQNPSGCIKHIIFNNHKIGLWNFVKSTGSCEGCVSETQKQPKDVLFNGDSYSYITKDDTRDPKQLSLDFTIKTFDENALIFLAPQPKSELKQNKCNTFMALSLKDGHILYEIHYNEHEKIQLQSNKKYNTGETVYINIAKAYNRFTDNDTSTLSIDSTKFTDNRTISPANLLRLKKINYYFGGVPPEYFLDAEIKDCFVSHTKNYFLGTMLHENYQSQKYYGLEPYEGELEFNKVWFNGTGFLKLRTISPKQKISFIIRTNQRNASVLMIQNFVKISIANGNLTITPGGGKPIKSKELISNDMENLIQLDFEGATGSFKINDGEKQTVATPLGRSDGKITNIEIGNAPGQFIGGIRDIVIDNKPINFNRTTLEEFHRVQIGRAWPKQTKETPIKSTDEADHKMPSEINTMKEMQNTEGCYKIQNYTFDPSAAKFGDALNSYVIYFLKDTFWKKDYNLEFEFRTFYPNGILFLAYSLHKKHYNLLEIREGMVQFQVKGNKRKTVTVSQKVNDGRWHQVVIEHTGVKKKRRFSIYVDGHGKKPTKTPKNRVNRELYFGGIPDNITVPKELDELILPFRGCIRSLKINGVSQGLVQDKNTVHHNIGQCFPSIEKGSYFGGDAYAIYQNDFHVNEILELNLEFRTAEQNGIILSVSSRVNSPALSIELQNGAIVMTVDMGNGVVSNVTNNLSEFALCNNQWHNVTALYSSTELTVNVDGIRKSWVQSDINSLMDELEAPLYIGGLPDDAPVGTLKTRENFKGCIRNIKIDEKLMDWPDMEELNNVYLNSCPISV